MVGLSEEQRAAVHVLLAMRDIADQVAKPQSVIQSFNLLKHTAYLIFVSACVATSTSTDDGTNGNFYCINGGTVGGTTGGCTCTSCHPGYSGTSCETADRNIRFSFSKS